MALRITILLAVARVTVSTCTDWALNTLDGISRSAFLPSRVRCSRISIFWILPPATSTETTAFTGPASYSPGFTIPHSGMEH